MTKMAKFCTKRNPVSHMETMISSMYHIISFKGPGTKKEGETEHTEISQLNQFVVTVKRGTLNLKSKSKVFRT